MTFYISRAADRCADAMSLLIFFDATSPTPCRMPGWALAHFISRAIFTSAIFAGHFYERCFTSVMLERARRATTFPPAGIAQMRAQADMLLDIFRATNGRYAHSRHAIREMLMADILPASSSRFRRCPQIVLVSMIDFTICPHRHAF